MAQKRENEELSSTSSDEDYPELPETKRPKSTGLFDKRGENHSGREDGESSSLGTASNNESTSNFSQYSDYSKKLMGMMGYKTGEGLGKFGQGRAEIVESSKQRGRRGLGFEIEGLQADDVGWVETDKEVEITETPNWITSCELKPPTAKDMADWIVIDEKKTSISDETEFCRSEILQGVLACKSVFDSLADGEFLKARTRANPYEMIKGAIFQNRAAMKMANMDAVFDFMFSSPRTKDKKELLGSMDLLYFADICAGPGGFSEYMLWRNGWHCKGFGFTLKGENDFKLDKFLSGTPETFEPFYGVNGIDGDGDIMNPDNLMAFKEFVLSNTDGKGVHFVMGDGGFSVAGQENMQEVLTKRLVLCQFLCAMSILRKDGYFLCKTFDLFTPFTVGLIYLLYRAFDEVSIHKPITSRPANSERYVICKGFREDTEDICSYLFYVNDKLGELNAGKDILEVVPLEILKADKTFCSYMTESNESLGENQINGLRKLQTYVQNVALVGKDQGIIRAQCLEYWQIPDITRAAPRVLNADIHFEDLLKTPDDRDELLYLPKVLNKEMLGDLKILSKFKCYLSAGERVFLLGLGRSRIFKWDGIPKNKKQWQKLENINLEIPKETLIEVEIVDEMRGEGKGQRRRVVIHVIDALVLGGKDIRNRHYTHRMQYAAMFLKAIAKPSRPDMVVVKTKTVFSLTALEDIFESLNVRRVKGRPCPTLTFVDEENLAIVPNGVTFFKHLNDPWSTAFSKSQQKTYFYNSETRASQFDMPHRAIATFGMCARNRYFWDWRSLTDDLSSSDPDHITKDTILDFIRSHTL